MRRTAQRILCRHLVVSDKGDDGGVALSETQIATIRPTAFHAFWPGIGIDLTSATRNYWDLSRAHLRYGRFGGARFIGYTNFSKTTFTRYVEFSNARFSLRAEFQGATIAGSAWFGGATFEGEANFAQASFGDHIWFSHATFNDRANFRSAKFAGDPWFGGPDAIFSNAEFDGATFIGAAIFDQAEFASGAEFRGARAASQAERSDVWPEGWRTVPSSESAWLLVTRADPDREPVAEPKATR
ncbi:MULTISPECIES: pentapeptide repeat-containing protein [unclassified Micromonospora]|uniref:pentapeptide repeat-containing protein n=1 Tax=unclassified Micromonospora TaxID=2617518 RepID=UPI002FF07A0B